MACKSCGARTRQNQRFCEYCGAELETISAPIRAQHATSTPVRVQHVYHPPQPIVVNVINTNNNRVNQREVDDYPYKSKWTAFFLCVFLGYFGVHRFYVGKVFTGLIYLFTGGFFIVGWVFDALLILIGSFRDKYGHRLY